jgi:phospholipase C
VVLALSGTSGGPTLRWMISNEGRSPVLAHVNDALNSDQERIIMVNPGLTHIETEVTAKSTFGWYDLSFTLEEDPSFFRRFTGHLEDGNSSRTHPGAPIILG